MSLNETVDKVDAALAFARQLNLRKILVNVTAVHGFDPPTSSERYRFCQKWANTAGAALHLAMVARSEMIDPDKFGVTVFRNRGAVGDVFVSEAEAAAWLDSGM
jgi:hypothetical protein